MNIDKILSKELKYKYLNNVKGGLNKLNLSFEDLNNYVRCGRVKGKGEKPDSVFTDRFGDVDPPAPTSSCLCGHFIIEQCYLCPKDSHDVKDIIIVGNECIERWGFKKTIWGKGEKIECDICGSIVNKSGISSHKKREKCKKHCVECNSTTSTEAPSV